MTSPDLDAELVAIARAIADPDHPVKRGVAVWAAEPVARGDRVGADRERRFAVDDWKRCAERGIHGVRVPTRTTPPVWRRRSCGRPR